jgi:hypothetical protein
MSCFDIGEIEQFVRNEFDGDTHSTMTQHISSCAECHASQSLTGRAIARVLSPSGWARSIDAALRRIGSDPIELDDSSAAVGWGSFTRRSSRTHSVSWP